MEMDLKFQAAVKAVKSITLEVDLAKMTYNDQLKKGERDDTPRQATEPARPLQIRPKISKRQKVMNPLKL